MLASRYEISKKAKFLDNYWPEHERHKIKHFLKIVRSSTETVITFPLTNSGRNDEANKERLKRLI